MHDSPHVLQYGMGNIGLEGKKQKDRHMPEKNVRLKSTKMKIVLYGLL